MNVSDRVALVTGSGRGIGRGIALVLAENGADVVVSDINLSDAQLVAKEISGLGRKSTAVYVNVMDQKSIDRMVTKITDQFGKIDILVNNAGVIAADGWETRNTSTEDDWDLTYEVNVKGVVRVTEAVTPRMKERRYGKIVNIASVSGRTGSLTSMPYSASKAAVINLTQTTALVLAPFNINVNTICPGILRTEMWNRIATRWSIDPSKSEGQTPSEIIDRTVNQRTPLGRSQTPKDIGNLATFLASDKAHNITGQAINVSGGSHMN